MLYRLLLGVCFVSILLQASSPLKALRLASKLSQQSGQMISAGQNSGQSFLGNAFERGSNFFSSESAAPVATIQSNTGMPIANNTDFVDVVTKYPTLSSWVQQFNGLPKNCQGANFATNSGFAACGNKEQQWQEFYTVLTTWLTSMIEIMAKRNWLGSTGGIDIHKLKNDIFQLFAQKVLLQPGESVYLRGDLHGDIFSLLKQLQDMQRQGIINDHFKIIKPGVKIAFLGDYVDRGKYGCEVLYTMMRLAIANPEHVIYTRGNHEDVDIQASYGFKEEIAAKFNDRDQTKWKKISSMYNYMPVVCYIGCQDASGMRYYMQCCHGGLEIGYEPQALLNSGADYQKLEIFDRQSTYNKIFDRIYRKQLLVPETDLKAVGVSQELSYSNFIFTSPTQAHEQSTGRQINTKLGFMWSDFDVVNNNQIRFSSGRGFVYGELVTHAILQLQSSTTSKIVGVMRAHQHAADPRDIMMQKLVQSKGVYKLWNAPERQPLRTVHDGLVWTYNVGPDSVYGQGVGFNFDAYAKLTVQSNHQDWRLEVYNTNVL